MDLLEILDKTCAIARQAGRFIREQSTLIKPEQIEIKGLHDLVSYVDKSSEEMIINALKPLIKDAGFIAEESEKHEAPRYNWIIDPLDGTTNFLHHLPIYSVSIALKEFDEIILGVVYEINNDECFYSCKGEKCYLNGNQIVVSSQNDISNSLIATGFPYRDFSKLDKYVDVLQQLMRESQGIRRCGSAAVDLAYVAAGRFEGFFEYALCPWDVAAGAFLVLKAGGRVSTFSNTNDYIFGKEIVAGNADIHRQLLDRLAQ